MRLLLVLILLGAGLWSGYWFVSSTAVREGFEGWFAERQAEGWVAETSDITVSGFPNRIDTTFTDISLADPATGLAWDAPFFQILALSYKPNHVIAVWPETQRVASPYDKFDITSSDMRASARVSDSTDLALQSATLTAENVVIDPATITLQGNDDQSQIAALTMAVEEVADAPGHTYRFGLRGDGVSPSLPWRLQIDPIGALPDHLQALNADVTVTFDAAWDRFAIERARPQPQRIKVRLAEAKWGQLELQLAGEVTVNNAGQPKGQMTVKARNWRDILALGVNTGLLPEVMAGTLEEGLGMMARMSGNPNTLDLPLDFSRGQVYLGPIPLGPSPVLRIR